MARITPSVAGEFLSGLEDDKPYRASIASMEWQTSEYKGKQQTQLIIDWAIDGHENTVREYVAMKLGTQQNGQGSKLRQILNAIGNQEKMKEIAWFDDETLEWSYDDDRPYARLEIGLPVILRGETIEKKTENGPKRRFVITGYRPSGIAERPPMPGNSFGPARPMASRGVSAEGDDEIPF